MKIVVLAGGLSTERDVSFVSGMQVYKALKRKGHDAILMDVFLGYDAGITEDIFEKDYDWAADIGAISDNDPDISKVKAVCTKPLDKHASRAIPRDEHKGKLSVKPAFF